MEWTDMVHYQQQMQKIIRFLLPVHKSVCLIVKWDATFEK